MWVTGISKETDVLEWTMQEDVSKYFAEQGVSIGQE